ncbi:C-5 sterol desaturase [Scheffersomyces xylosifermentans]|uniref:C-5 sterol desaturase n=1 Tax=Scheffersomyces xylosifermentans TaxID=1304137 RepID=UPI00315CAA0B
MDIVLEVVDYYAFDRVYASLLPKGGLVDNIVSGFKLPALAGAAKDVNDANWSFNSSITTQSPLSALVGLISNYQNKNEIYGLAPKYLPAGDFIDASFLARSNLIRELISLFVVTAVFGWALYFGVASFAYCTVFDKKIFNHPRYLKNQIWLEIERAATAIPVMVLLTTPFFLGEINGYSFLYMNIDESTGGWKAVWLQIPSFILFTDCGIYFIHRWLHWPAVYKALHKPHHKWIVCTPFASHAFHPVDGFAQSLPYHVFPFLFPLHKVLYLGLFVFVNFWTVMIHDGQYLSNDPFVNGTACHTVHHLYFNYNYGQFTTLWDRIGRSYRRPDDSLFIKDSDVKLNNKIWKEQTTQMEKIRGELEGKDDDRVYI